MDIFNKKKLKEKERILKEKEERVEELFTILGEKNQKISDLMDLIKQSEVNQNQTMCENQKLIDWIEKILKNFGTMDVTQKHLQIPIYKPVGRYGDEPKFPITANERIEIPAITIIKMG